MSLETTRRYWYGWLMAVRAYRMARKKKHGAGATSIINAMKIASWYRFMVDGQHLTPMRYPRWIVRGWIKEGFVQYE